MPKKVNRWQCDFCHKISTAKGMITRHEKYCYKNPDRTIRIGELALWRTIPNDLTQEDSYDVPMSEWMEPIWDAEHQWWPRDDEGLRLGMIYNGERWVEIPGYIEPRFAPGYSWRDEHVPNYVEVISSKGLCRNFEQFQEFVQTIGDKKPGVCEHCKHDMTWALMSWSDAFFSMRTGEWYFEQRCVNEKCKEGK